MKSSRRTIPALYCLVLVLIPAGQAFGRERIEDLTVDPSAGASQAAKPADPWAPCRFLLGDWVATEGTGQPGEAVSGITSFAFDLDNKIMVRRNRADYAPKPGEKTGISHRDLLLIYQLLGESQLRAFYVDNEGHAINYLVSFPKEGSVSFETEPAQKGPRFRLEYQLNADHTLTIIFSMAPPGGAFQVYTKGSARRKQVP